MKPKLKLGLYIVLGAILAIALIDSLGVFDKKHYFEVPHGSHTHYVAKDRDPNVSISQFPTRRPGPGERITPQGQIVSTR
ncbi:MAG: hypothetical protein KJO98_08720 [Rhodothermia bacterium]|nr:hypothetical protein [Rhodothermia bacterium]